MSRPGRAGRPGPATEQRPQLRMRRRLVELPELLVPSGYALRHHKPDDCAAWAALLNENGELGRWGSVRAARHFEPGAVDLISSFFVTWDGAPVATGQLLPERDGPHAPMPALGWVAVAPAHRGRGLGRVVSLAVLHAAAAAGHTDIFLLTDDHRLPAIRIYLGLGFEPWVDDPGAEVRWRAVRLVLGLAGRADR